MTLPRVTSSKSSRTTTSSRKFQVAITTEAAEAEEANFAAAAAAKSETSDEPPSIEMTAYTSSDAASKAADGYEADTDDTLRRRGLCRPARFLKPTPSSLSARQRV